MDYEFPQQLFPSFYNCGPPDTVLKHGAGSWGCYDRARAQGKSGPLSSWTFTSRHQVKGQIWHHTEPVPIPLLSPLKSVVWSLVPPDPLDFKEHMQNFFVDHLQAAFGCSSALMGENLDFKERYKRKNQKDSIHMWKVKSFLDNLDHKKCFRSYWCPTMNRYSSLLWDVVHDIPPELLGALLHEELSEQRDSLLFSEGATGGALAFVPFSQSRDSQHGCLIYPRNQGLSRLNFHRVALQHQRGGSSCIDTSSSKPTSFQLKGPVRQISSVSLLNQSCVAVRSDYFSGVWRFSETHEPHLLQVVNTKEVATCISASPHVLGEVLVASESGAANLWTVGKGMQKIREEDSNLYFNAKSLWRWCEFSAHPRVMLYADRTGVELTDIRVSPLVSHTLFRISNSSECRSGERLILSKYLGDAHCFHHLVTTQFSAYIMDERFPGVPMLKWDHAMQSPPIFCQVLPGSGSGVGRATTTKVLLGSQRSQEIMMLQYSGGKAEACCSHGPPQALLRPRDSLRHLPVQIPHRQDTATSRLSSPAAGLTCIQTEGGAEHDEESVCVLQLTDTGDIFYQVLKPELTSPSQAVEDKVLPNKKPYQTPKRIQAAADSQLVVSETSSDEDVIQPTQAPTALRFVAETPERIQQRCGTSSDSSSEDSESGMRWSRKLKHLKLQVVVNEDPERDQLSGSDDEVKDVRTSQKAAEHSAGVEERHNPDPVIQLELSDGALAKWKLWLKKLMKKSSNKESCPHRQNCTVQSKGLLAVSHGSERHLAEEEHVQRLRRDLRACMSTRSLMVPSSTSAHTAPAVEPVPDSLDPKAWTDELSQRLTLSWQGEEAWRAWWDDCLGLNKEEKEEALRRRRRKEKEARRASGRRLELSGSFASSMSYQSELSDFSDSQGWSSAVSQGAWSDSESVRSQPAAAIDAGTPRAGPPSEVQTDGLVSASAQSVRQKPERPWTPSSSQTFTQPGTPSSSQTLTQPGTPSSSQTLTQSRTPSSSQTCTQSGTPSSSQTLTQPRTPSSSQPLTQPGTPSSSQTFTQPRTPRSSQTFTQPRTPRSSQTFTLLGTPSSHQTSILQQNLSSSQTVPEQPAPRSGLMPPSQRKKKWSSDILSSLFDPQAGSSQHNGYALEEESSIRPTPRPVASSQLPGSQSSFQRSFRGSPSQDFSDWSQSFSQSSQGRLGLSQSSQPKKKKSRMGF